ERVVRFVEAGQSRHAAAGHFEVSVAFVVKLMAAYRQTGSLAAKPEGGWRYSKLDPHRDFLVARVTETADITMPELAMELAGRGLVVVPSSLARWLIRNGFRFKKNPAGQRAGSARHRAGARGMDGRTPAQDAA
ncbi:MAG: transposase, partial [Marmoricola sp.]|nr:transposase [Marmoricola sp.]